MPTPDCEYAYNCISKKADGGGNEDASDSLLGTMHAANSCHSSLPTGVHQYAHETRHTELWEAGMRTRDSERFSSVTSFAV